MPFPKYFLSEWSFAQFRISNFTANSAIGFGESNVVNIICGDGRVFQAQFDSKNGGECEKIVDSNLFYNYHKRPSLYILDYINLHKWIIASMHQRSFYSKTSISH